MASHIEPAANAASALAGGRPLPAVSHWDSSARLLADPYRFIGRACRAAGADAVQARLLMQPTVCLTGSRAAALFYDNERFERAGAAPEPLRATLFGKGGVQSLDQALHARRKALFLETVGPGAVLRLTQVAREGWAPCLARWHQDGAVPLYAVAQDWLMRAGCRWLGLSVPPRAEARRRRQTVALFDSAASGPLRHLQARWARRQAEHWLAAIVAEERSAPGRLRPGTPAHAVAWHRDADGSLMNERIAAVELLNLLRPLVAISVFVVFVAHALETDPLSRAVVSDGEDPRYLLAFVQEVRRHYPFFPMVAARTRCAFEWEGYHFPAGRRAMLDLYGTNHDARRWDRPDEFMPERFLSEPVGMFDLVPQGGGDAASGHRCPGEGATVALMKLATQLLVRESRYRLPAQDLRLNMRRLPALPIGGMQLEQLRSR